MSAFFNLALIALVRFCTLNFSGGVLDPIFIPFGIGVVTFPRVTVENNFLCAEPIGKISTFGFSGSVISTL